jgi:hypothetical protein
METIVRNQHFVQKAKGIKPDAKKRVVLPKELVFEGVIYHVYSNASGQILFDPQVTIPASELWVLKDKNILDSIDKGMIQSADGKVVDRGSFAKYAKDDL